MADQKGSSVSTSEKDVKAPKEGNESMVHSDKSPRHVKETHGTSDDIDKNTPVDEVKGPGVFHRMKEEVEAVVGSILPKK